MITLVLVVCLVVIMLLWLLSLLGAVPAASNYHPWLAFFAVLFLALLVLLSGAGPLLRP